MQAVLEELLLRARLVDAARMRKAKEISGDTGCTLAHALVKLGFVTDRGLATLLSQALNLRVVDPSRVEVDGSALATLAGSVAYRLRVLPVRVRSTAEGEFIYVAMSDPTDRAAVHEVEASTGREVIPAVAEERSLERALRRVYATESLQPVSLPSAPRPPAPVAPPPPADPPLVVGVLEGPALASSDSGRDDAVRAQLLANDDDGFFTESTEELMTVYSRALARAERGTDDKDLVWLQERRELAGVPDAAAARPSSAPVASAGAAVWPPKPLAAPPTTADFEDVQTAPLPVSQLSALSAPVTPRAVPLPLDILPIGEERTEPDLSQTLAAAKSNLFRPPTCVVAADPSLRSTLGAGLAGYLADLHVKPSLDDALLLGEQVPLGYVVIVAPRAEPNVVDALQRLAEIAGAPRIVVVGGDPAFQVVPGVHAWIDLLSVGPERVSTAIVDALEELERA